jgi:hypothetical protein
MSCPREVLACEAKGLQQTLARYVGTGEATYVRVPTGDFTNNAPHGRHTCGHGRGDRIK